MDSRGAQWISLWLLRRAWLPLCSHEISGKMGSCGDPPRRSGWQPLNSFVWVSAFWLGPSAGSRASSQWICRLHAGAELDPWTRRAGPHGSRSGDSGRSSSGSTTWRQQVASSRRIVDELAPAPATRNFSITTATALDLQPSINIFGLTRRRRRRCCVLQLVDDSGDWPDRLTASVSFRSRHRGASCMRWAAPTGKPCRFGQLVCQFHPARRRPALLVCHRLSASGPRTPGSGQRESAGRGRGVATRDVEMSRYRNVGDGDVWRDESTGICPSPGQGATRLRPVPALR